MAEPEDRTADGRWIVVGGRKWRASDPAIPGPMRQELVDELMDARRAVAAAKRADDEAAERGARARVQDAKVALGERGRPWWEPATPASGRERLAATILALAGHRAPDKTICPSDAARAASGEGWRQRMDDARAVTRDLAREDLVEVTQKGKVLDPDGTWHGPIRIRSRRGD